MTGCKNNLDSYLISDMIEPMINNWKRITIELPQEGERVLISDGEIIAIAQYIISENHHNWLFDNSNFKCMKIDYWQSLPELPQKIEVISAEK